MRHLRYWLLLGFFLFGIAAAMTYWTGWGKWRGTPILAIPVQAEVAEMRASVLHSQYEFNLIPEFNVPADHVPIILAWLRPAEYNREPWRLERLQEWGEIIINTRGGGEIRIRFYNAGVNPAVLTVNGTDQFYAAEYQDESSRYGYGGLFSAIQKANVDSKR